MGLLTNSKLNNFQLVLFLEGINQYKAIDISEAIYNNFGYIFKNDPNINTAGNNPFNVLIPWISFINPNKHILNIVPSKVDFTYFNTTNNNSISDMKKIFNDLIKTLTSDLETKISRIGVVINYSIPKQDKINASLNDSEILSTSKPYNEINLSWLEKITLGDILLNKWTRYIRSVNNSNRDTIIIDINTLVEMNLNLRGTNLFNIFDNIVKYIEEEI